MLKRIRIVLDCPTRFKSYIELENLVKPTLFHSHGLILRKSKDSKEDISNGITLKKSLKNANAALMDKNENVFAETDMRALYNPTRIVVIENAVQKLIAKIEAHCPKCNMHDFSVTELKSGLKCESFRLLTRSTLSHILSCQSCGIKEEITNPGCSFYEDQCIAINATLNL